MASLRDLLEDDAFELPASYDISGEHRVQLSMAISLKRIADALWDDDGCGVSHNLCLIGDRLTHYPDGDGEMVSVADIAIDIARKPAPTIIKEP